MIDPYAQWDPTAACSKIRVIQCDAGAIGTTIVRLLLEKRDLSIRAKMGQAWSLVPNARQ
jgi:hypothetical protein